MNCYMESLQLGLRFYFSSIRPKCVCVSMWKIPCDYRNKLTFIPFPIEFTSTFSEIRRDRAHSDYNWSDLLLLLVVTAREINKISDAMGQWKTSQILDFDLCFVHSISEKDKQKWVTICVQCMDSIYSEIAEKKTGNFIDSSFPPSVHLDLLWHIQFS